MPSAHVVRERVLPDATGGAAIAVAVRDCPPLADLAARWQSLEERADGSFYLSWHWIGNWLHGMPAAARPALLEARRAGRTVGLALIGRRRRRRHGFVASRQWHVNASGDEAFDDVTIEYNGLLVDRDDGGRVQRAMIEHLVGDAARDWDELFLGGFAALPDGVRSIPGTVWLERCRSVCTVDLERVRNNAGRYLELLGEKPRYQIRKSEKAYAKFGALTLDAATDATTLRRCFDEMVELHQANWTARGERGSFADAFSLRFHHSLLEHAGPHGRVQMLRLRAGDRTIGYLYNFVDRGRVLNYQSAFDYRLHDGKDSPGLVSHARAVTWLAAQGQSVYDFLAGDERYKRSLATDQGRMHWGLLQRDHLRFRVERLLREARQRLRRALPAGGGAAG